MPADEHDILIWDSEIRRPRIGSGRKPQARGRAAFILDDAVNTARCDDDPQGQTEALHRPQGTEAG